MSDANDQAVKILIQFIADTQGAEAAAEAMNKLKVAEGEGTVFSGKFSEATKDLGEEHEKLGEKITESLGGHRALHQIFHLLGHETVPQLGNALGALRFGPLAATIIGAGLALEYFKKKIEESAKELDDFAALAADRGQTIKEALEKAFVDVISEEQVAALKKRFDDMATGMERYNTAAQQAVDLAKELRAIELEKTSAQDAAANATDNNAVKEGRMTKEQAELNRANRAAAEERAKTAKEEADRAGELAAKKAEETKAQADLDALIKQKANLPNPDLIGDANKTIAQLPKSAQAAFAAAAATAPSGAGDLTTEIGRKATEAYLAGQNEVAKNMIGEVGKDGKPGTGLTGDRDKAQKKLDDLLEQHSLESLQASRSKITPEQLNTFGGKEWAANLDSMIKERQDAKGQLDADNKAIVNSNDLILQNEVRIASIKSVVDAEKEYKEKIDALTKKIGDLDLQITGMAAMNAAPDAGDPSIQAARDAKTNAERRGIIEGFKPSNAPSGSDTLIQEINTLVKAHQLTQNQALAIIKNLMSHSENMTSEYNALSVWIAKIQAQVQQDPYNRQ